MTLWHKFQPFLAHSMSTWSVPLRHKKQSSKRFRVYSENLLRTLRRSTFSFYWLCSFYDPLNSWLDLDVWHVLCTVKNLFSVSSLRLIEAWPRQFVSWNNPKQIHPLSCRLMSMEQWLRHHSRTMLRRERIPSYHRHSCLWLFAKWLCTKRFRLFCPCAQCTCARLSLRRVLLAFMEQDPCLSLWMVKSCRVFQDKKEVRYKFGLQIHFQ